MDKSEVIRAVNQRAELVLTPILQEFGIKSFVFIADPSDDIIRFLNTKDRYKELYFLARDYIDNVITKNSFSIRDKKLAVERILRMHGEVAPWKRHSGVLKNRFKILERDGFKCVYCGRSPSDGATLQIDHIHPKSRGGSDDHDNLVSACYECNIGKNDILLEKREEFKALLLKTRGNQCHLKRASQETLAEEKKVQ